MTYTPEDPRHQEMLTMLGLSLRLLLTAPNERYDEALEQAEGMRELCMQRGIPNAAIENTMENAAQWFQSQ